MARLVGGDVVVVPFPFTDLASVKVRPALVLVALTRGDVILCQITSQSGGHPESISIRFLPRSSRMARIRTDDSGPSSCS